MSDLALTRSRTLGNTVAGALLVLIGLVILGNAVVATTLSVRFLGWMLLLAGIVGLVAALVTSREGGSWSTAVGGSLLLVVGLMCLRNVEAAALTLTLIAGSLFLLTGVLRLVAAVGRSDHRWTLLFAGAISTVLGLAVLLNLFTASYALLGVLLGVQAVAEGLTMIFLGGLTLSTVESDHGSAE
jgi:uncharacterized membrane protein HdeD (DUF308 family)